jgi:hypothetical protein
MGFEEITTLKINVDSGSLVADLDDILEHNITSCNSC